MIQQNEKLSAETVYINCDTQQSTVLNILGYKVIDIDVITVRHQDS